ncbi:amidase family protein [Alkalihalobacillus sp. BA299]|uniref:amidase family protein n=1 Tax=Alkalihalobacillus sp. BA299 TaxID=2815938 RepID=UPI001AD9632A|nr:amidase family protein [Alkalihalobacillus sp. BA299]
MELNKLINGTEDRSFTIEEATIVELQEALEKGKLTSEELVTYYLKRIEMYDKKGPALKSIIYINDQALETARSLDEERKRKGKRGLLHGIPIILKDNYDTFDMPTSAGSKVLKDSIPLEDSFIVKQLREAGAIIIAKSNLHEFAFGLSTNSSLGGQTLNPYDLRKHAGGSSGGTGAAIAANFAAVGMGTDTGCSIRYPASQNNLVGLRATYGLTSRSGIVPISTTQDVGGPIGRTVSDVAAIMDVISGKLDSRDPITEFGVGEKPKSFLAHLKEDALQGTKIGVFRDYFGQGEEAAGTNSLLESVIEMMETLGAEMIDITIPEIFDFDASVYPWEFESALNDYFHSLGENRPVATLKELIEKAQHIEGIDGQLKEAVGKSLEDLEYKSALENRGKLRKGILEQMKVHGLDAIFYPTFKTSTSLVDEQRWEDNNGFLSANSGLPAISFPIGFTDDGFPVGAEFLAGAFEEAKLIELAYSYENVTKHRTPPSLTP